MPGHKKILIVTYSWHGNINPSLRFANRLIKMGVDVTFCTSDSVLRRIDKETMPHGLTFAPIFSDDRVNGKQPTPTMQQLIFEYARIGACAIAEIISSAMAAGQPYDHLLYTTVIPWAARVAHAHGIRSSLLWIQSASMLDIYYYYFNEYEGLISSNNHNPTFPINLPGLPPLTIADLPSFMLPSNPKEHNFVLSVLKDHVDVLKITSRILVNTFDELEVKSIRAIEKLELLPIGPLIPLEFLDEKESPGSSLGWDFFDKPDDDYIQWLNTKAKSSVVYVAFGSLATLSMDLLEEIASGLLESRRPFLWVIRDSEQAGRLSKIEELKKHGMIVGWCSQVVVLSHQAIGCYVMHGGWNSTVETLAAGVPTVLFPQWSDQATNAKMMEDVWRTGVRVRRREEDGVVEGKEIERCVEFVMGDEDIKRNAEKWRELAREALSDGGSSTVNIQAFLNDV
ncbi:hypothetical protein L2E82_34936 [Cichorium intybus]|uniref:Uncharacterized protein n=1 Tax=Cichorium intybus TaxID=13427 RepID=A0ACB9BN90_CICIN|nr:hypothetical protein L2E82_34936 [Cichorium intybus]